MDEFDVGARCRRAASGLFLLLVSIASSCRCPAGPGTSVTPARVATPAPVASPTAAPAVGGPGTLYAWANPLGIAGQFADHTWATSYSAPSICAPQSQYWYSWGSCHATGSGTTARDLGHAAADLGVANCICRPDVESYAYLKGDQAHGGIDFYGISGVCHQLSNRILFATAIGGADPLTVKDAHGYLVSRFVYGTYGSDTAEWAARKIRCLTAAAAAPTSTTAMMRLASTTMTLDEDLKAMFDEQFHKDYARNTFEQIRELRRKLLEAKQQLDTATMNGRLAHRQYAENVNNLVNSYLGQATGILGPGGYQVLFGLAPGERIGLVDPDIAARSGLP